MKKTLVTGATGFVGRQVLAHLKEAGCALRVVARGDIPGISDIVNTADLFTESADFWQQAFRDVERVVHVAWYVEPGHYLTSPQNSVCMDGTLRMARAAAESGVSRFVGVGTCFEYDVSLGYLKTTSSLKPLTPYGIAKAETFLALSKIMKQMDISFAWCRLFYLYGAGEDRRRLVPYLREKLSKGEIAELTSGTQIRDFLDVSEAGRRIAEVALSETQGAFNICSGQPLTVAELATRIADEYGRRDLLRFGAKPDNPDDPQCVLGEPSHID